MSDEKEEVRCVRCHHVAEENEKYCIKCGAPLVNSCTDSPGLLSKGCGKQNHPGASYCAHCGSPTIFNKEGLVPHLPSFGNGYPKPPQSQQPFFNPQNPSQH